MASRKTLLRPPPNTPWTAARSSGWPPGAAAFAADMTGLEMLKAPALAGELKAKQKHVILLWLAGGSSQLAIRN